MNGDRSTRLNWLALWAKLGQCNKYPEKFHPVACHLLDVGLCALELWNRVLREEIKSRLAERFCSDVDRLGKWWSYWIALHDIGKVWPGFQLRGRSAESELQSRGFDFREDRGGDPKHAVISTRWMMDALCNKSVMPNALCDKDLARRVAVAIGGHHGLCPSGPQIPNAPLRVGAWSDCRTTIAHAVGKHIGVIGLDPPGWKTSDDQSPFTILAGLTAVADWIGSNDEHFPWVGDRSTLTCDPDDFLDKYAEYSRVRAKAALVKVGWQQPTPTKGTRAWADLFANFSPRPLQEKAVEIAPQLKGPGIVLAEAPMGEGKTEFAFFLADHWVRNGGAQGVLLALPTQATTNAMFERFRKFLGQSDYGIAETHLLHGKAIINDAYQKLFKQQPPRADVTTDEKEGKSDDVQTEVVAERWFAADKRQAMLAPFGVGTIDQALLSVLQVRHSFVRLFGLAGKVVVFDEVHAYDTYMSTILESLLTWLGALGSPVILLSATLPAERRKALLGKYLCGSLDIGNAPYPRVSVGLPACLKDNLPTRVQTLAFEADPGRRKTIHLRSIADAELASAIERTLVGSNTGCIAVLRNTVKSAQATYRILKRQLGPLNIRVILFHARFVHEDRQRIENRVLKLFSHKRRPRKPTVLVATQVIEQSLDLDFDLMISDWAPIDLLFQRTGRLWRHARGDRPGFDRPELWLVGPEGDTPNNIPLSFGKYEKIYSRYVLLKTFMALKGTEWLHQGELAVELPEQIDRMIETTYGAKTELPIEFVEPINEAFITHEDENDDAERKAKSVIGLPPTLELGRTQSADLADDDDPSTADARRAATRDGEPSVVLILLYETSGRLTFDADGRESAILKEAMSIKETSRFLQRSVTVADKGCWSFYVSKDAPPQWQRNSLLKHARLVRLAPDDFSLPDEYPMEYRIDSGLILRPSGPEKEE